MTCSLRGKDAIELVTQIFTCRRLKKGALDMGEFVWPQQTLHIGHCMCLSLARCLVSHAAHAKQLWPLTTCLMEHHLQQEVA